MAGEPSSLHELFRKQRLLKRLTQSQLARKGNCTQSAVSMFEAGRTDVLARDRLKALADILQLDISGSPEIDTVPPAATAMTLKYCPTDECLSNIPYVVNQQLCFVPTMIEAPAGEQTWCEFCGEILEDHCPNPDCTAKPNEGGFCVHCGTRYVTAGQTKAQSPVEWADDQRHRIREIRSLSETRKNRPK